MDSLPYIFIGRDTGASQPTWLEGGHKSIAADASHRTAVCGEEIGLEVTLHNPLMSEMHVSQLRASVEASTSGAFEVGLAASPAILLIAHLLKKKGYLVCSKDLQNANHIRGIRNCHPYGLIAKCPFSLG